MPASYSPCFGNFSWESRDSGVPRVLIFRGRRIARARRKHDGYALVDWLDVVKTKQK